MEFFKFLLSNFWIWAGFTILFGMVLDFFFKCWNRFWRHWTIRKHGYPPAHCDADGDYKNTEENGSNRD